MGGGFFETVDGVLRFCRRNFGETPCFWGVGEVVFHCAGGFVGFLARNSAASFVG